MRGRKPSVSLPTSHEAVAKRRRALAVLAGISLVAGPAVGAGAGGDAAEEAAKAKAAAPPQLPGGGRRLFPDRRVVAFYGSPRDPELGALGVGSLQGAMARLRKQARGYGKK